VVVPDLTAVFGLLPHQIAEMTSDQVQMYVNRLPFVEFKQNSWVAKLGALILNAMGGKGDGKDTIAESKLFSWLEPAMAQLAFPGTLEDVLTPVKPEVKSAGRFEISLSFAQALEQARKDKLLPSWVIQRLGGYALIKAALEVGK
jgi:hypothetical protein